jgi:hypothetical protein
VKEAVGSESPVAKSPKNLVNESAPGSSRQDGLQSAMNSFRKSKWPGEIKGRLQAARAQFPSVTKPDMEDWILGDGEVSPCWIRGRHESNTG